MGAHRLEITGGFIKLPGCPDLGVEDLLRDNLANGEPYWDD